MSNELKNKMELYWNESSLDLPKNETEKLVGYLDYINYATQVLNGEVIVLDNANGTKTMNELFDDTLNEADELARTIVEHRMWDDSYFNSVMDRLTMYSCIVEGEYFTEQYLYVSLTDDERIKLSKHERAVVEDTHSKVCAKRTETSKKLDRALDAPQQERAIYLASITPTRK